MTSTPNHGSTAGNAPAPLASAKLIDDFLTFKQVNRNRSPRTIEVYRLALDRLVTFMAGREVTLASDDELVAFTGAWLHRNFHLQPAARKVYVSATREFYRWLYRRRHIAVDIADRVPVPQLGKPLPDVMSLASAEKLMWAPDFNTFEGVRDGAMMALLVGCGFRVSGLVGLNESDIITREVDGKPRLALRVREKGNKSRQVPVPPEADLLLRMYLEHPTLKEIDRGITRGTAPDRVLFVSVRNRSVPVHDYRGESRRLSRRSINVMLAKYGKEVGISARELHPHAMRHLFGTELAESNIDILQRQQLMGHADPKSTAIYEHLAVSKATRALDQGNPLSKIRSPVSDLLKRLAAANSGGAKPAS